jgi:hypothetical protein
MEIQKDSSYSMKIHLIIYSQKLTHKKRELFQRHQEHQFIIYLLRIAPLVMHKKIAKTLARMTLNTKI